MNTAPETFHPQQAPAIERVFYEQPLGERVRCFLRLEFLFQQSWNNLKGETVWDTRATLAGLLEILTIFGRNDLKTELIKELERHNTTLSALARNPNVDQPKLQEILGDLDHCLERLHAMNGQVAPELKQNEFLCSIRQRSAIPGGTCDFDLPGYHHWLQRPPEARSRDLKRWLNTFHIFEHSVSLLLQIIRQSAQTRQEIAEGGLFQRPLDPSLPCQLIRVAVPSDCRYYAEISGGRHRFSIRFLEQKSQDLRGVQTSNDVSFELACCVV